MKNVFDMDYDIERILSALKVECGKKIEAEHTLLIFDEIQENPKALNALKYFYENAKEYAIVAAGQGQMVELTEKKDYELINAFSDKYADLLRKYYYVGGMPEVVSAYLETDDMQEVRTIQQQLLLYYANDFSKHAPKETIPRIHMVWNSIPMQLSKENRKFIYRMVREGARAKDFELAIQWLLDCGLIHKCYRIHKPGMPLISYMDMLSFKIYMSDAVRSSMSNYREQDWMVNVPLYILRMYMQ